MSTPTVQIPAQGPIEGVTFSPSAQNKDETVTAYLGIPFAQPPLGELRWKRPQLPAPQWPQDQPRKSKWPKDPYQCLDHARFVSRLRCDDERHALNGVDDEKDLVSEDCLYLNAWVPNHTPSTQPRAVLVWIYGGGFNSGSTSLPCHDGASLANASDCIVVSIAYRVGVFGFLGSKLLEQFEGPNMGTGNYGLWDVVAGLQWIQANISAFGGDPGNVTAFGESAGAILLHYLMLSPAVPPGLFARVGLFSGTALTTLPQTIFSSQATFDALANALGGTDLTDPKTKVALLKSTPAAELQDAFISLPSPFPPTEYSVDSEKGRPARRLTINQARLTFEPSSECAPTWDSVMVGPAFLPSLLSNKLPSGRLFNGSKGIFFGHTADEGSLFNLGMATRAGLGRCLGTFPHQARIEIEALYGMRPSIENLNESGAIHGVHSSSGPHISDTAAKATGAALVGDMMFAAPVQFLTFTLAADRRGTPAYRYTWAHRPSLSLLRSRAPLRRTFDVFSGAGSYHSSELPFLFANDATDPFTFALEAYPNTNTFHQEPLSSQVRDGQVGFTPAERKLSKRLIDDFAMFAKGMAPWKPINGAEPLEAYPGIFNVPVMTYDEMPVLGASTPEAMVLHVQSLDEERSRTRSIPVGESLLRRTLPWRTVADPDAKGNAGTSEERYDFWTRRGLRQFLMYYYGDEDFTTLHDVSLLR